jgi:hypothetical protein
MTTTAGREPPSLEERISRLELSRFRTIGRINALTTMLLTLWGEYLENQPGDALEKIECQRQLWLEGAENVPPFPGADPDQLQLISDENRKALDDLSKRLVAHFRQAQASKSKKRKTAHPPSRPRFPGKKA